MNKISFLNSFRGRLLMLMLLVSILPLLFYILYETWQETSRTTTEMYSELQWAAEMQSQIVEQNFNKRILSIELIAEANDILCQQPEKIDSYLAYAAERMDVDVNSETFFMVNKVGEIVSDYEVGQEAISIADREYFQQAVQGKKVILGPRKSIRTNQYYIYIAWPVFSDGEVQGVLVYMEQLEDLVGKLQVSSYLNNNAYLIDQDRFFVSVYDDEQVLIDEGIIEEAYGELQLQIDSEGAHRVVTGQEFIGRYVDFRGRDVLGAARPLNIPGVDWYMLVEVNRKDAYSSIQKQMNFFGLLVFLDIVVIAVLAFFLADGISRPISVMANAAHALSEGNINQAILLDGPGETGVLADAFRRMIVYQRQMANAFRQLAEGDLTILVTPQSTKDALGHAFVEMAVELKQHRQNLEELVQMRTVDLEEANALLQEEIIERKQAEKALRESEERLQRLSEASMEGMFIHDEGRILDVNSAMLRLFGYRYDELVGIHIRNLVANEEDWQRLESRSGVDSQFLEITMRRKDGSIFYCQTYGMPYLYRKKMKRIGVVRDISLLKQAEHDLREREQRLESLFNAAEDAIFINDTEGIIRGVNPAGVRLLGFNHGDELIGLQSIDFIAKEDVEKVIEAVANRLQGKAGQRSAVVEYTLLRKDGTRCPIEVTSATLHDGEGQRSGVVVIARDITDRKAIEAELRHYREQLEEMVKQRTEELESVNKRLEGEIAERKQIEMRLQSVLDHAALPIFMKDLEGRYLLVNRYFEEMFGLQNQELIGKTDYDLFSEDMANEFRRNDLEIVTKKKSLKFEEEVFGSGAVRTYYSVKFPLMRHDGEIYAVGGISSDISERKKVEQALLQAKEAAESANHAKSTFLANMSHELRTPLNAILGFSQILLRDQEVSESQREYLQTIWRSGEHLLGLINDILNLSKIEAGQISLNQRGFDLYYLLEGLEEMFWLKANDKGLSLLFDIAEETPRYIYADEGKLRQILINLIGNAVKFTEQGGVVLRVFAHNADQDDLTGKNTIRMYFSIEDSGPGISSEEYPAVFDIFVQTKAGVALEEGSGLGLPISRQYVEMMGGNLTAESELGKGSVFRFDVLATVVNSQEINIPVARNRKQIIKSGQKRFRVLVVEDQVSNRDLMVDIMSGIRDEDGSLCFELQQARNGKEALDICATWLPDLIWMDIRMPVMDGIQAAQQIRLLHHEKEIVIIALTAGAFEEEKERILKEGMDDFISKPFHQDDIFAALEKYLGISFVDKEEDRGAASQFKAKKREKQMLSQKEMQQGLLALPQEMIEEIEQAAVTFNREALNIIAENIRQRGFIELGNTLSNWANMYDYGRILSSLLTNNTDES